MLLIGRSRSADAGTVARALEPWRTGTQGRADAGRLFIVATQCLEAGTDVDLDGLVTEAAPLDALRQRFGAVNRGGRPAEVEGVVLVRAQDVEAKADDPAYGARTSMTWSALERLGRKGGVDFGIDALEAALARERIDAQALECARKDAPIVTRAHIDAWAQTAPSPKADPEVTPFLHGSGQRSAGVSVVWRGDVRACDLENGRAAQIVALMPPRAGEALELPLAAAQAWLAGERRTIAMSDIPEREAEGGNESADARRALRWAGPESAETGTVEARALHAGDLIVVPADYGGCDGYGWAPDARGTVRDIADAADAPYRGARTAVRVTPDIACDEEQWAQIARVLQSGVSTGRRLAARVRATLGKAGEGEEAARCARDGLDALARAKGRIDVHYPYEGGASAGAVLVAERGSAGAGMGSVPATEDEAASHTSEHDVDIDRHCARVAQIAGASARTLGLGALAGDIECAGALHDAGKADERVQALHAGGNAWSCPQGAPLAKSAQPWTPGAREGAGLPERWRHEALSVRMARTHPLLEGAEDPALVVWLIGAHHGLGRPLFRFVEDAAPKLRPCLGRARWTLGDGPGPQSPCFDFEGADWPALFETLRARYGAWGLAHLETLVRLADHRASEEEADR